MAAKNSVKYPISAPTGRDSRFVLIGGFLGAGKTTAMARLARWLIVRGLRPGLITNDQGEGLVDTVSSIAATGGDSMPAVRQVTGGCFCCRAGELGQALRELDSVAHPDVFIAEPVGSCTDLVATILIPLSRIYPKGLARAPMSVLLDAKRVWDLYFGTARRITGGFSKDVRYILLKQMEEAEILVVNKTDLLSPKELARLGKRLREDFGGKEVLMVSTRTGDGLEAWFSLLLGQEAAPAKLMDMDYDRYAEGEALLGWYNSKLRFNWANGEVDGNLLLIELARNIQAKLEGAGVEIAHFKMSLQAGAALAVVNVVRNGDKAELSARLPQRISTGELLVNLRAEGKPLLLKRLLRAEFKSLPLEWVEEAAFRPGRPKPVHRVKTLESAGARE